MKFIFLFLLAACLSVRAADLDGWSYSAKVRFNTTSTGANVSVALKDFPLLVRFATPSPIFTQARSDGSDLRFTDPDGTVLSHQIERWDAAAGKGEIWVKVPQVDGFSSADFIDVHWGNHNAEWVSDGSKVFPAANGFTGVWHLGEGGAQTRANSVGTGNHAVPKNYMGDERSDGVIGLADSLNGAPTGAYLDLGPGFENVSTGFTFSTWAYSSGMGSWERILDLGLGESKENIVFSRDSSRSTWTFMALTGTEASIQLKLPDALPAGRWTHLAVTTMGTSVFMYKDGAMLTSGKMTRSPRNILRTKNYLGKSNWHIDPYFKGKLDEPVISLATRSPEWIKLSYENQRMDSKMITLQYPAGNLPVSKEDLGAWTRSRKIHFNTASQAGKVMGNVKGFPLLVRLSLDNFPFAQAQLTGNDLRFTDPDSVSLPFEFEFWQSMNGFALIWVLVPQVDGNSDQDYITMHWGNPAAASAAVPGSVFSAQAGFRGAWHFDEFAGNAKDAVTGSLSGINSGARPTFGVIGGALQFAGGSNHVAIPAAVTSGLRAFTISMWAKEDAVGGTGDNFAYYPTLAGMGTLGNGSRDLGLVSYQGELAAWHGFNAADMGVVTGERLNDSAWHHVAMTYTGSMVTVYHDGIAVKETPALNVALPDYNLGIGASHANDNSYQYGFKGAIDAVQISGSACNTDWINLSRLTQMQGSPIVTYGEIASRNPVTTPDPAKDPATAPTAPVSDPPAGNYQGSIQVRLSSPTAGSAIFYTLDGSEPDSAKTATIRYSALINLDKTAVIKAKAFLNGAASTLLTSTYVLTAAPIATGPDPKGDSLAPGKSHTIDAGHWILYPAQEGRSPVLVHAGAAWNPAPSGFSDVGPLFAVSPTDTAAAFPGLLVVGTETMAGLALYRMEKDGRIHWMPRKDLNLWVPSAGSYFWAKDVSAPRITLRSTAVFSDDSVRATFSIEDNVANPQCMLHIRKEAADSLGWWPGISGDTLGFTIPLSANHHQSAEINLRVSDHTLTASFPSGTGRVLTLGGELPSAPSPIKLERGLQWSLAGVPFAQEEPVTLSGLAAKSGMATLYGAVWGVQKDGEADYELLEADDTLPRGQGVWLASREGSSGLVLPAGRMRFSDTDGLFPIKLVRGWNLVTCPTFKPIPWPVSRKDGDLYLRAPFKSLHGFDGSDYVALDSLRPWEGYYVHYNGEDTVIRVGLGAGKFQGTGKAGAADPGLELSLDAGGGAPLKIGTASFAKTGLGIEDEMRPPVRENGRGGSWLSRGDRALVGDYVPLDPDAAMRWTVVAKDRSVGSEIAVLGSALPEGFQAWAVSPSRGMKYRLEAGSAVPVAGNDTLDIYIGTPQALAGVADLRKGTTVAGAFSTALTSATGGFDLRLNLPAPADMAVRVLAPDGRRVGGLRARALGTGLHAWNWTALSRNGAALPQGLYLVEVAVEGADWRERRVIRFGAVR